MISTVCFVVLHNIVDSMMNKLYLPYIISMNPDIIVRTETLTSHKELYFLLKVTSGFMLFLYSCLMIFEIYVSKIKDRNSIGLSFIYIKHILDILITPHMTIMQYEMSRVIMWSFTTPLMLKMLSDENELTLSDLQINYHILAIVPHIFIIPFKNQYVYMGSTILLSIPGFLFMRTLYKYKHLHFANLYLLIWGLFMVINLLDVTQLFDPILIHALYNLADTIFKFVFNFVIANYNEHENIIRDNMDLQSVNFVSTMINCIKQFENNNKKLTPFCGSLIKYLNKKCMNKIPKTDSRLKLELLQKILPFNFDKDYVDKNMRPGTGAVSGTSKKFDFICVMFMDIVNYTELAKKYDEDIIFKLLDAVYHCFDTLIKKYSHLQKIETIGDAYFVVGDIYREELNHKIVVKEIILLAMEFIKEVKHIITPDGVPLCIRIGINIGAVSVGILGNEIPRLCVVGNTVNMASRLQSTADSDTIQLSRHIYEHAEDTDFGFPIEFIEKDNIFLKNIGSVVTYNISREPTVPPYAPSLKH